MRVTACTAIRAAMTAFAAVSAQRTQRQNDSCSDKKEKKDTLKIHQTIPKARPIRRTARAQTQAMTH